MTHSLRGKSHKKHHASSNGNDSREDSEERFLRWVAYERLIDDNILREERFTCPLLWCRKRFDDPKTLLKHVLVCDQLREGTYWCPEHQAPERFSTPVSGKHRSIPKLSVCLRNAVRIIRRLGSRRSKNNALFELEAHQAHQPPNGYIWDPDEKSLKGKRERVGAELSTTRSCELKIELPTTVSRYYELQSPVRLSVVPDVPFVSVDAMEVDKADDSSLASIRSISPIEDGYDVISSNMSSPMSPCYTIDTGSQGTINDNPLGSDVTPPVLFPVSAFSLDHINDDGNLANRAVRPTIPGLWEIDATVSLEVFEALKPDQPIAFEAMSHPCQGYGNEKMICHIVDSTRRIQQHSDDRLYGHGLGRPQSSMANSVYCRRSVSGDDIQMQSQLALTEGLRHVSSMLYKRSLRNLRREPVTTAVRSFIENMPLLENIIKVGLSTLRKVLSNTLPNRLMDIYAMLHVAYVVAIVINQKDVSEIQRDLYADILNWGLAIKSIDERALFANIAQLLWASEHSKLNCPRIVNNVLSGTLNQTCFTTVLPPICELSASHSSSDSRTGGFMSSQAYYNDTTALFQALKSGTAVYLCKQYLDSM